MSIFLDLGDGSLFILGESKSMGSFLMSKVILLPIMYLLFLYETCFFPHNLYLADGILVILFYS